MSVFTLVTRIENNEPITRSFPDQTAAEQAAITDIAAAGQTILRWDMVGRRRWRALISGPADTYYAQISEST